MPNAPFFSIVMAAYNSAAWIVPAIRSALDQSYRAFEMIVVGDGCTDRTAEIVTSEFGSLVRWKNLEANSGSQSAPNSEGIRLARGTHIAYLGHDDIWSRDHLRLLARVIGASDPDFAVSGAVYHGPPGARYYILTGLFTNSGEAGNEFFPPSSFAHKRDVPERIGGWRDPAKVRAPVDCQFLLDAVAHGCRFKSTEKITVHKFAAGHRHLAYRFPSSEEQEQMFRRLRAPDGDGEVLRALDRDIEMGAHVAPATYPDFTSFAPGQLYRDNRRNKGLDLPDTVLVEETKLFPVDSTPSALDWRPPTDDPLHGPFRWSGPNTNPVHFLNVRTLQPIRLRIRIIRFADEELAHSLRLELNDRPTEFAFELEADGSRILTATFPEPVDNGLRIRFRMPYNLYLPERPNDHRAGLALSSVEITPV